MKNYNDSQLKVLSEYLANSAVAWLAAGVIAPIFTKPSTRMQYLTFPVFGIIMSLLTLSLAVDIVKNI